MASEAGQPGVAVLIARHLGGLEAMPLARRIRLGWFTSQWLARGMNVGALCNELGLVRQTGYRWMEEITGLFGDKLHDPQARIELQAALAGALPAWQAQAAGEPLEPPMPGPTPAGLDGWLAPAGAPAQAGTEEGSTPSPSRSGAGRSFYPVAATDHVLAPEVTSLPGARSTGEPGEMLVPAAIDPNDLRAGAGGVLVYGPPAPVESIGESLRLVRRAADLLAQDHPDLPEIPRAGTTMPVSDLSGLLLAEGTPLLTQLAAERQLASLAGLEAVQRVQLAEALLDWLTTGDPVSRIAERAGVAVQTMHSRLQRARSLLSPEALSNPHQRLELTIALHATILRWREQAAG